MSSATYTDLIKYSLDSSGFDYHNDRLIVLGDICDGYPEVRQCINELLKIKHCDLVLGNPDLWTLNWALYGEKPEIWTSQGGYRTIASYNGGPMPQEHIEFLKRAHQWIDEDNKLFVQNFQDMTKYLSGTQLHTMVCQK